MRETNNYNTTLINNKSNNNFINSSSLNILSDGNSPPSTISISSSPTYTHNSFFNDGDHDDFNINSGYTTCIQQQQQQNQPNNWQSWDNNQNNQSNNNNYENGVILQSNDNGDDEYCLVQI
jgi:hypothetical protein